METPEHKDRFIPNFEQSIEFEKSKNSIKVWQNMIIMGDPKKDEKKYTWI